jgi:uncharacterized protein (TIGR02600 family)
MPVVEPYPISEPFSTAGKVNLNYQIQPFNYITRSTALRAALHAVRVTAVPAAGQYDKYKTGSANSGSTALGSIDQYDVEKSQLKPLSDNFRKVLNRDGTIKLFDEFFQAGSSNADRGFFKSATQICEQYLCPLDITTAAASTNALQTYWADKTLGGDNTREKPYADLYPRVTTKSNTYTVHFRVQTLRQVPRTTDNDYATWQEGKDGILGEYRGATTIERYIDPADPRFDPSYTPTSQQINPDRDNLDMAYRFRTVINKKFVPQ